MSFIRGKDSFRVHRLPTYVLGSIAENVIKARVDGRDVVDLSQMNPNTGVPPRALDRLVQATLLPHNHRYSSSQGIARLRESIVRWYQKKFGIEFDVEREVVVTMGIKEGMSHLLLALLNAGDTVIVPTPRYPIHSSSVLLAGANIIELPLSPQRGESMQSASVITENDEAFFDLLSVTYHKTWPRPKLMVLSFPHNPTTAVVTVGFFERLVEFARKNSLLLVHDFAYADICYAGYSAPSIFEAKNARDVAVEFYSLSKSYGLAGWRIGFCVGNAELVSALKKVKSYIDFGIFQPLQIAAIEVLNEDSSDESSYVSEIVATYKERRDVLVDGLNAAGWRIEKPQATVFVWAPIPSHYKGMRSREFCEKLLNEANVAACPGIGFCSSSDDYVRLALVVSEERLRKAVASIGQMERTI